MMQKFRLDFDTPAFFSLSSIRAGREAVVDLSVTNVSDDQAACVTLEIESEPAFFTPISVSLGMLASGTKRILPDLKLSYDRTFFAYTTNNVSSKISVRLVSGGEELAKVTRNCDLLSHDSWGGVHFSPELLSCLVTPMQTQVQDVARKCRQRLKKNKIHLSHDGYQDSMNLDLVRSLSEAVFSAAYDAVHTAGVIFSIQPPELTRRGAAVQLPEVTLAKKAGNALDAAILYASCIESLSLHPVILFSASKIYVGGFLEAKSFASPIMDSPEILAEVAKSGALCLFEASSLAKGTSISFSTACQLGLKAAINLDDLYFVLDIYACREQGLHPIDNRVLYEDGIHFEKPGLSDDDDDIFFNETAIDEASPVPFAQNLRDMRKYLEDISPYNPLINHPEDERVRILVTEPERLYHTLAAGDECGLFSTSDAPFGYRTNEAVAAQQLDVFEKRAAALSDAEGDVCLCFGLVKWNLKDSQGEAPLMILPLDLYREHGRLSSFVTLTDAPKLNEVLLHFLSDYFGVDLSALHDVRGADLADYLKRAFFMVRSELSNHPALTFVDSETFFTLLKSSSNERLNALSAARLESHPLSRAICAMEPVAISDFVPGEIADPAPASLPTPYPLSRDALHVCAAMNSRDYALVDAPICGGKSHLGAALAFSTLNHADHTVLYVTGEHANARDYMRLFAKAGIDDLAIPLSVSSPAVANYTMKETVMFPPEEYYTLSTEFSDKQRTLSRYEKILSEELPCGCTPEEAIYCFDHVRASSDVLHFAPEKVGAMDEATVNRYQRVIRELTSALSSIGSPIGHPLRYVRTRGFSYEIKAEAVRLLDEYSKKFKEYITFVRGSCAGIFPRAKIHNERQEQAFLDLLHMIGQSKGINPCFFEREIAASDLAKAETIFGYGKDCCELKDSILALVGKQAFDLPVKDMIVAWRDAETKRGGVRKKIRREITQKIIACASDKKELNVLELLYQIEKYQNYRAYLFENAVLIQRFFGVDILAPENDVPNVWARLIELCRECTLFDRHLSVLGTDLRVDVAKLMRNFTQEDAQRSASLYDAIIELQAEKEQVRGRFLRYLDVDAESFCESNRDALYDEIPKFLKELSAGMENFQQWTEWLSAVDVALECGFQQVIDAIENGVLTGETLEDAYARAFFLALCEYVFLKHPVLNELRGNAFEEKLLNLNEIREKIYECSKQDIRSKHLRRYVSFLEDSGWDAARTESLTPAVFSRSTYTVTCRYPILVANAEDAVRFLDATPARFDLLVLDDAHTITMPSALALIPRAEKVVILGSSAAFGCHGRLDSDADLYLRRQREDIPSFWNTACTVLEPFRLSFSRQRSAALLDLVCVGAGRAFDTIPFVGHLPAVQRIKTPGIYDPLTFVNLTEVMQTVEEVVTILRDHKTSGVSLSLGVCTSTKMQKLLVLQTLAKRLREEPDLYEVLRGAREAFYVSSLQEEPIGRRDIVLWSMTVGPTKRNNMPIRSFGLFSDPNGTRRIASVLGSARDRLCVVHSVHTDSLDAVNLSADAQETFRRVAKVIFAQEDRVRAVVDSSFSYDNPIAERIAEFMREKGYSIAFAQRCGNFYLDLVITSAKKDVSVALLLDETVFSVCSGHVLGELDLMNHLRERGFVPIHIRATDWFENDQQIMEGISALLSGRRN